MASKIQSFGGLFVQCVCLALLCENVNAGDKNNKNRRDNAVKTKPTGTTSGRRMSADEARRTICIA